MYNKASLTSEELCGLTAQEINFVIEYLKDFHPRHAAERSGYHPDRGAQLLAQPHIEDAMRKVMQRRLVASDIDAQWLLMELVDNHGLARQSGKLTASNTALATIAKLAAVDAFAADKVIQVSDQQVLERLQRARKRVGADTLGNAPADPVSFL